MKDIKFIPRVTTSLCNEIQVINKDDVVVFSHPMCERGHLIKAGYSIGGPFENLSILVLTLVERVVALERRLEAYEGKDCSSLV